MIIKGNLLEAKEKYIIHQCNCTSAYAAGIAKSIFDKYIYSDVYSNRAQIDKPGSISIAGDGIKNRFVINAFAQYYPGYPKSNSKIDSSEIREIYFKQCLEEVSKIRDLESIALPFGIGCGLAGGDWSHYLKMIEDFSLQVNADVVIYKL